MGIIFLVSIVRYYIHHVSGTFIELRIAIIRYYNLAEHMTIGRGTCLIRKKIETIINMVYMYINKSHGGGGRMCLTDVFVLFMS
jgi:hypothetical protein